MPTREYRNVFWEADRTEAQLETELLNGQVGRVASDTGAYVEKLNSGTVKKIPAPPYDSVQYNASLPSLPSEVAGLHFYNPDEKSMQTYTGNAFYRNVSGETEHTIAYNDTGSLIPKLTPVYVRTIGPGLRIRMYPAAANTYNLNWAVWVTCEDVANGTEGMITQRGTHLGVDTTGLSQGTETYMDCTAGDKTSTRPKWPCKPILLGTAVTVEASGVFYSFVKDDPYPFEFDGCIIERHAYNIVVSGTSVFLDLYNFDDNDRNLWLQIDSEYYELDTTTLGGGKGPNGEARVELIQGTKSNPQSQIVYVELVAGVPTLKTTSTYPASSKYARVGDLAIPDYATVLTDKAYVNRRCSSFRAWDGQGMIAKLMERWAIMPPEYDGEGITPSASINTTPTPDLVNVEVIEGYIYQKLRQHFPALSVDTDGIYVINAAGTGSLQPWDKVLNLILANETSNGTSITNARAHFTIIGLVNYDDATCKLGVLLPNGTYATNDSLAYSDYNGTAVRSVPIELKKVAFLIAQVPLRIFNAGNEAAFINGAGEPEIISLLGQPIGAEGGVGGASGGIVQTSGTWAPAINFGGATTGITYVSQNGTWTKTGRLVKVTGTFELSSKGTATGGMYVVDLPFTVSNEINGAYESNGSVGRINNMNSAAYSCAVSDSDNIQIFDLSTGSYRQWDDTDFNNNSMVEFSATYVTD